MGVCLQLRDLKTYFFTDIGVVRAVDGISRWNVVGLYNRATATTAAHFLDILDKRMPFPVKAIIVAAGKGKPADTDN